MAIFDKTDFLDLEYPPEVQVEPKTCIAIFRTPVPAILNHTNLTGLAGGAIEGQNVAHLGHVNAPGDFQKLIFVARCKVKKCMLVRVMFFR